MTYQQAKDLINEWIITNGNNEITAVVLNPILQAINDAWLDTTGNKDDLDTTDQSSLVAAINELKAILDTVNSESGVMLYKGLQNPNVVPPSSYKYADFYMQVNSVNLPIQLFQYTGLVWEEVDYSGGSGGVQSVTGTSVDDTDPTNPVVNAIPLAGMGAFLGYTQPAVSQGFQFGDNSEIGDTSGRFFILNGFDKQIAFYDFSVDDYYPIAQYGESSVDFANILTGKRARLEMDNPANSEPALTLIKSDGFGLVLSPVGMTDESVVRPPSGVGTAASPEILVTSISVNEGTRLKADDDGNVDLTISGGGGISSITGNDGIEVDDTDPDNPALSLGDITPDNIYTAGEIIATGSVEAVYLYSSSNIEASARVSGATYGTADITDTELGALDGITGNIEDRLNGKQATLVSGTNIKTVGGQSLVGSGNVTEVQNSMTASTLLAPSVTAVNTELAAKQDKSYFYDLTSAGVHNLTANTLVELFPSSSNSLAAGIYEIVCHFNLSSLSGSGGTIGIGLLGTASLSRIMIEGNGVRQPHATSNTAQFSSITTTAFTTISTSTTMNDGKASFRGKFVVTSPGSVKPAFGMTVTMTGVNVDLGSYYYIRRLD